MGDRTGRIISTRATVDHWSVIINGFGICYILHVCVCVVRLSRARGGKVQAIFHLFFVSLMQAIA